MEVLVSFVAWSLCGVMTVQIGPSLRDTISVPSYTVGVRPPRSGTRGQSNEGILQAESMAESPLALLPS